VQSFQPLTQATDAATEIMRRTTKSDTWQGCGHEYSNMVEKESQSCAHSFTAAAIKGATKAGMHGQGEGDQ
jgi:hypothetical protein